MALIEEENTPEPKVKEMSFLQHLEELRWHLFRSAVVIVVFAVVVFCLPGFFVDQVFLGPVRPDFISYKAFCSLGYKLGVGDVMCMQVKEIQIQTLGISEQFFTHMWFALIGGLILGFPFLLI